MKSEKYYIEAHGKRKYFETLDSAIKFSNEYFTKHNVLLGVFKKTK
jgi:hypothetical protein